VDTGDLVPSGNPWSMARGLRAPLLPTKTFRELLLCIVTGGAIGSAIMVAAAAGAAPSHQPAWSKALVGLGSFLEYVPALFLLEEVWFRGVLDSHLHHRGESRGILSAIYVSALWGPWHYPISAEPYQLEKLLPTVLTLLLVHIPIGALLSRSWRRSENLLVTCVVHALIDGVRNALLGLPS
jgi:membrane protease YdiL (CAAX protease family)